MRNKGGCRAYDDSHWAVCLTLLGAAVYGLWRQDRDKRQRETFEKALDSAAQQIRKIREGRERELEEYHQWSYQKPQAPAPPAKRKLTGTSTRIAMQVVISLWLLLATLFVILSAKYDANSKHWAFAHTCTWPHR